MSNFSFSHSVFERLALQTHNNQGPFGKGLTPYKTPEPSAIQNLTMGSLILTGFVTHRYLGYSYIIKSLPHNPHNPDFNDPDIESFWNIVGKGEHADNQHFLLFFPQRFLN